MKNEFIAINGKLESMTKKEAREKIISFGYSFQQDINSKTTIVVNGAHPLKKKKQKIKELEKNGIVIKIISEQEFIELITPKKQKNKVLEKIKDTSKRVLKGSKKIANSTKVKTTKLANNTKKNVYKLSKSTKEKTAKLANDTKKNVSKLSETTKEKTKNNVQKIKKSKEEIETIIKEQDKKIETKIDNFKIPKKLLSFNTLRIIVAIIIMILGILKMITIPAKLVFILAGLFILPVLSNNILRNIIFKIVVPISLIMVAFSLNIKTTLTTITGTWYSDTMTLKIGDEKTEMDVIDYNGRHILTGKNKFDNGFFEIKTDYKTFRYKFDAMNDSLCILNDNNTCRYYLDRVE